MKRITGNCLFRRFSYIITGSEDQHLAIHLIIVNHIASIAPLLLNVHIPNEYDTVEGTKMDQDSTWGTEVEMFMLAHLLQHHYILVTTHKMEGGGGTALISSTEL